MPGDETEARRVQTAGGQIFYGRVLGVLNITRSIVCGGPSFVIVKEPSCCAASCANICFQLVSLSACVSTSMLKKNTCEREVVTCLIV